MSTRILCVDDDANILAGYQRSLRKQFTLETALGGEAALELIRNHGPYAVVVADMNMPGMNGIQFLSQVREWAPDTIRFMLTGNADQTTAVQAVNQGHVFQFLTKPCAADRLASALDQGLRQYRLVTAERELLEQTLNGSVKVLTDVLSMVDPQAFGLGQRLWDCMRLLAKSLRTEPTWELELAAMLSQIGYVTIPPDVVHKHRAAFGLSGPEKDMIERVPTVGAQLIANIPRLEAASRIVRYQAKHFDGSGIPGDAVRGEDIPAGARMLKVLTDMLELEAEGLPRFRALEQLRKTTGRYDPKVIEAAFVCFHIHQPDGTLIPRPTLALALADLRVGHILSAKVENRAGLVIAGAGTEVTQMVLEKLNNFAQLDGVKEPLHIEDPTVVNAHAG